MGIITNRNKITLKNVLIISLLAINQTTFSQNVGINSTGATPNSSSILDLNTGNTFTSPNGKGFIPPNVALTSTTDVTTVASPSTSLLVYNTANAGSGTTIVAPGYYYWNGSQWVKLRGNDWMMNGNANTVDGTNFLGTTDSVAFSIKVNNQKAGRIDPGYKTTSFGYKSMNSNTTGIGNVGIGYASLYSNTTGNDNLALGYQALYNNTTSSANTAIGYQALLTNTTSTGSNSAFGSQALLYSTTGYENTAIGFQTLRETTTGYRNAALGYHALVLNTTGYRNSGAGLAALYNNTTGNSNAAFGEWALSSNTTGDNNTAIGSFAYTASASYSNSTAIGATSSITASNQVRIGNSSVTSIGGQVGWTTLSDRRFKLNIEETVPGLAFISRLRPVNYTLNTDAIVQYLHIPDSLRMYEMELLQSKNPQTGFIAQEVEQVASELNFHFSGVDAPKSDADYYGLRYAEFTVPLVKAVQELNEINKHQQLIIEELQLEVKKLKTAIEK